MDTAVEVDEVPAGGTLAHLVEVCECPRGYAGLSCQVSTVQFVGKTHH